MSTFLFLSGSIRHNSFNETLAKFACMQAKQQQVDAHFIDLRQYDLPIFSQDIEAQSYPKAAQDLFQQFVACKGFFIASPEYNGYFSPLIKNTIDWLSRSIIKEQSAFQDKTAIIAACSPGKLGGLRGLAPLRLLLSNLNVLVLPEQLAVPLAHSAFNEQGELINEKQTFFLQQTIRKWKRIA